MGFMTDYGMKEIVRNSIEILGAELTGIYLHGSMAMGCFNPDKSDIDIIAVAEDEISDTQKMALMENIIRINEQAPPKGIEISFVKRKYCNPFAYPTPFELHFSPMHLQWFQDNAQDYIEKMKGEDKDLAAHFTIIRNYGIVLWGEKIENVFAPVPKENYVDSIFLDIKNAKDDILEQPIYIILNLCRVYAYVKDGLCLSKKDGGKWGMKHLPFEERAVAAEAAACYVSNRKMDIREQQAIAFADKVLQLIKDKMQ